jgi:prophage antirepressor-like protein
MNNELKLFEHEKFGQIRTVTNEQGEVWFVLNDICHALDIKNPWNVAKRIDEDDLCQMEVIDDLGRKQATNFVNESGLYSVVLYSEKPEAKPFRKWVTSDVIPSIRKHGAYMTPAKIDELVSNPDLLLKLVLTLKEEKEKNQELAHENQYLSIQLDEAKEFYSIKRMAAINKVDWRDYKWGVLKQKSAVLNKPVIKIFDANYGEVNTYHISVWKAVYPNIITDFSKEA